MTILSVMVGRHVAAGGANVKRGKRGRGRPGGQAGAKAGAHAGWDLTRPCGRRIACHALTSRQHELRMGRISKSFRNNRGSIRTMTGQVLVLNSGSSSVKFALVDPVNGQRRVDGEAERVGAPEASLQVRRYPGEPVTEKLPETATPQAVIARILDLLSDDGHEAVGAGHRVVHGGERFTASVLVDDEVIEAIRSFSALAPLHNPANLAGIEAVRAARPDLPQAAVFDTAFHQSMPPRAYRYAVPQDWYTTHQVRRYGFHGTSYRYVSGQAAVLLQRPLGELSMVAAHLGNGCSAAAISDGRSVDTTMGLTPLEGLVMGTRSGDIDPGVFGYL